MNPARVAMLWRVVVATGLFDYITGIYFGYLSFSMVSAATVSIGVGVIIFLGKRKAFYDQTSHEKDS